MAEGGMDFHNPEYDKDDDMKEAETSFTDDEQFQNILNTQYKSLDTLTGADRDKAESYLLKIMVKQFYNRIQETIRLESDSWYVVKDKFGTPLFGINSDGLDYNLSYYESNKPDAMLRFYALDTIQQKYGVKFIRNTLGVDDYQAPASRIKEGRKEFQKLLDAKNKIATEEIPLQDISSQQEVQDLTNTVDEVETAVKTLDWDVEERSDGQTQTDMTKREMDGILKAMTSVKEEVANELAKLTETNKELTQEKEKLANTEDEDTRKQIQSRISELESERSARLEVINVNKEKLRSQVNRIKETINKILKEDTTLGQRLRTLFREQGITIVSILTAIGMVIGVIVEAVLPSGGGATTPPSKPSSGVKDWVKKQLSNLGKLLANLAGKAVTALPGVIGSIVSWLLSTTGKVVNWFGEHLWALVVLVVGLLYATAKEYIHK